MKIRKNLASDSVIRKVTYGGGNGKKYLIVHETDNVRRGANADAHGRLQASGNSRTASWHYSVDDKEIVQSFDDNIKCWGAGNRFYNNNGIQIEICVNSDGNFKKAVANAVELTKLLMKKHNISIGRVIQHNTASGKNCPRNLRSGAKGITWAQFKKDIVKTGGLTVSQYNKIMKEINALKRENRSLRSQLKNKMNTPSDNQTPSKAHAKSWEKASKKIGKDGKTIMDGTNPYGRVTREQLATILDRVGLLD